MYNDWKYEKIFKIDKNDKIYNNNYYYKDPIRIDYDSTSIINYGNANRATDLYTMYAARLDALIKYLNLDISSLNNKDFGLLVSIVTDPSYDSKLDNLIRNYGTRQTPNTSNINRSYSSNILGISSTIGNQVQKLSEVKKPEPKNPLIDRFLKDITGKMQNPNFRGWLLPNGQLLSEYVSESGNRQDHSRLVELFMNGLEKYDKDAYDKMRALYYKYCKSYGVTRADLDESFAVEVLGWIQIAHFGRKKLVYRGERWQDKLVRPFLVDYGFTYEIANFGRSYEDEFMSLFDNINEIIECGLEARLKLVS